MRTVLGLSVVLALAAFACGPGVSAGEGEGEGEGQPLEWSDAGIPDRPDAGPEEVQVCLPLAPLTPAQLPRCTAATRDCVAACPTDQTGEDCRKACWGSDTTPPLTGTPLGDVACQNCISQQLLSCIDTADQGVCHATVAAYVCCAVAGGIGCDDEGNNMFTCGFVAAPECFDVTGGMIGQCYAETDP